MHPFLILLYLLACYELALSKEIRYFYIYEWPEDVVLRWPDDYSHPKRLSFGERYRTHHGLGEVVSSRNDLYHTHQYSLFLTFMKHLRQSPYRTRDPAKASLFFIPYDLAMDSTTRKSDGAFSKTKCPKMKTAYSLLKNSPYFQRNAGADHFILHTINQVMLYFTDRDCLQIYKICYHCVKLSIDVYSRSEFRELQEVGEFMNNRWYSIPFPSNVHLQYYSDGSRVNANPRSDKKWYHIAYLGSEKVTASKQRQLRVALRQECYSRSDPVFRSDPSKKKKEVQSACLYIDMSSHTSLQASSTLFVTDPDTNEKVSPYYLANLCLMPGGDFPTRKGVLDALLSGCVPVTFQLNTAQLQWQWHWGSFAKAMECTIYFPRVEFMKNPTASFDKLMRMSQNETLLEEKRKCINSIRSRMQYSVPVLNDSSLHHSQEAKDAQIEVDAMDVILARLLY